MGRKHKGAGKRPRPHVLLKLGKDDPYLLLIFAVLVFVAGLAGFVALEEEYLTQTFIGIDLRGKRRGV